MNLSENCLSAIDGLPPLPRLRHLNLAANPISEVGYHLRRLPALTALNMAATAVSSFRALWQLADCTGLQHLVLNDPLWGEAPLARLGNYRGAALRQLQSLMALDHSRVTEVCSPLPAVFDKGFLVNWIVSEGWGGGGSTASLYDTSQEIDGEALYFVRLGFLPAQWAAPTTMRVQAVQT